MEQYKYNLLSVISRRRGVNVCRGQEDDDAGGLEFYSYYDSNLSPEVSLTLIWDTVEEEQ